MKTRIHVNRHHIRLNADGGDRPVFTAATYKATRRGHSIRIDGPCELVYHPDNPLKCGARAWIETQAEVHVFDRDGEEVE